MYPFVPFQVVVSVKTLRALVAFERAFVERRLRWTVHLLQMGSLPAVESILLHVSVHVMRKGCNNRHLSVGTVHVRQDRTW